MDSFHSPLLLPPLQTGRLPLLSDNNGDQRILISSSNNSFLNNNDDEEDGDGGSDDSADDVGGHEYIAVDASSAERRSCGIVADDNNANDDGAGGVRRGCFGDSSNVVYDSSSNDSARVVNAATVRQHNKFTLATPSKTIRTRCSKTICWQFLASVIYTLLYVSTSPCLAAKQEGKYAFTHIPKIRFMRVGIRTYNITT